MTKASPNSRYVADLRWTSIFYVAPSIFSHIRTKNYVRLAPAGEDAANNLQEARGTWWVAWKTGISVGFMGWSRVTSWSSLERSPGEGERASRPAGRPRCRGPLPLKKTRDRPTGDNSCGIANEPSGHPNDGWLGGTRTQTPREASIHLEKIPLFGAPFPLPPPVILLPSASIGDA